MSTEKNTTSLCLESSPIAFINQSLEAAALKTGPRILLARIVSWCGKKGRCWYSVETMAARLSVSVRTLQRWKKELIQSGLLAEITSPYRTPYLIPYPDGLSKPAANSDTPQVTGMSPLFLKEEGIDKRCTVDSASTCTRETPASTNPNVNAIDLSFSQDTQEPVPIAKPEPPSSIPESLPIPKNPPKASLTPAQWLLIQDIETGCSDFHSRGHFVNLVRRYDEGLIYTALSITREKLSLESGVNGGAFFYRTLQGMAGDTDRPSYEPEPEPKRRLHQDPSPLRFTSAAVVAPPEPESLDVDALKKGWRLSYKSGGISSLLSLVEKCGFGLDVRHLWTQVKEMLPDHRESDLVDRFLDVVSVRMKHREAAEVAL